MSFTPIFDAAGNPEVQYVFLPQFELESGGIVENARVGYCVFGENANNPVIIVHPALTGSPKAFVQGKCTQGDGWWTLCIGPGKFLDTSKYTLVCIDHFGGNGDSTSAKELGPLREQVTFADGIHLIAQMLSSCGVNHVHAVIGGSIGGGQAFEWLYQRQVSVDKILDISGSALPSGKAGEFFQIQADLLWGEGVNIDEISSRLQLNDSDLIGRTEAFDFVFSRVLANLEGLKRSFSEEAVLAVVRQIGFLRFVTPQFYQEKWEAYFQEEPSIEHQQERLQSWLEHQGKIFAQRFSADALAQLCAMVARAPARSPEEIADKLYDRNTCLYGFSVIGDVLFEAANHGAFYRRVSNRLSGNAKHLVDIQFIEDRKSGHDHFLTDKFLNTIPLFRHWL